MVEQLKPLLAEIQQKLISETPIITTAYCSANNESFDLLEDFNTLARCNDDVEVKIHQMLGKTKVVVGRFRFFSLPPSHDSCWVVAIESGHYTLFKKESQGVFIELSKILILVTKYLKFKTAFVDHKASDKANLGLLPSLGFLKMVDPELNPITFYLKQ